MKKLSKLKNLITTLTLVIVVFIFPSKVLAAVAFDAVSESHTGTTGAINTYSWTHTVNGTPRAVVCFTTDAIGGNYPYAGVTYGGVSMVEVTGGIASDASPAPEGGTMKAWFLGSGIPTGNQTVQVTESGSMTANHAYCYTFTASGNTTYAGVLSEQITSQTLTEENINDGSPGSNSVRVMAVKSGAASVGVGGLNAGANSTYSGTGMSMDLGSGVTMTVYETTPGQGSRPVGVVFATADDVAAVYLAVVEIPPITISGTLYQSDGSSPYLCSTSGNVAVNLRVNGGGSYSGTCSADTGAWSVTGVSANSGQTIYAYTSGGSVRGSSVLVSNGAAQSDVSIIQNRVVLRDDVNGSITNTEILAGNTADADDLISFSGSDLTVSSSYETHIYTGDTYAPGANVSTGKLRVVGNYSGSSETLTLTASGTATARPLYVNGGTFTAPATTVFQGSSATDIEATTFNALSFTPTITGSVSYTLLGAETINGNFTINPTAASTQLLTVNAGGNITVASGYTLTLSGTTSGTSTLDLRPASTDYNLSTGFLNISTAGTWMYQALLLI